MGLKNLLGGGKGGGGGGGGGVWREGRPLGGQGSEGGGDGEEGGYRHEAREDWQKQARKTDRAHPDGIVTFSSLDQGRSHLGHKRSGGQQ